MDHRPITSSRIPAPVRHREPNAQHGPRQIATMRARVAIFAARLVAALIMGLLILALSGLLHTAAAGATIGRGASYLWATWSVAAIVTCVVAFSAPTGRIAWGRLCALGGLLSTGLLVATLLGAQAKEVPFGEFAGQAAWLEVVRPVGAALGAAYLSGALGIAALLIAIVLFAISYGLLRPSKLGSGKDDGGDKPGHEVESGA